jgi:predicted lipase
MEDKEWVGIQFNLDRDMELKSWLEKYKNLGIKTDGEHITINFGKNELKNFKDEDSIKTNLIKSALRKCLKRSSYTNIYTYLDADSLNKYKTQLLNGEFKEQIRVDEINNMDSILSNYDTKIESPAIRKILRKNKLMLVMDKIFYFIANRDFELEQKLTLEIAYEDKEEWGVDRDSLNVSIQLEIIEP